MSITEYNSLSEKHLPLVEAYALRLTQDPTEAEDLVQDVIYKTFKHRHRFERGTNFRAWMFKIVHNTFVSKYRKEQNRRKLLENKVVNAGWSTAEVTYNQAEYALEAEQIIRVIESLPAIYHVPFLLHFQGVKYKTISRMLNIPVGTAKSRVFTARTRLKVKIRELYAIAL